MGPKYLLSGAEIVGELRLLTEGQGVFESQLYELVETGLEIAIFGNTYNPRGIPARQLVYLGFTSEEAENIQSALDRRLSGLLNRTFPGASMFFKRELMEVRINHAGDIELSMVLGQRHAPAPPPSEHDYLENIRARLEAGDWYPEKIRRLVGM